MASQVHHLHFVLIPLMCPGHIIPMVDIGKLLAQRGVVVTIVTTPLNALRFKPITDRAIQSGLAIRVLEIRFPSAKVGLPEGCENLDNLPDRNMAREFFAAAKMLQEPIEQFLEKVQPCPSCIITDRNLAWTSDVAKRFHIPRLMFDGTSCFSVMCSHFIELSKIHENVSDSDPFVVPGLPHRIELTRNQLPSNFNPGPVDMRNFWKEKSAADSESYGLVVNSFEEMEGEYVEEYRRIKGKKIWCIGPVSLCNKEAIDRTQRGNTSSVDQNKCLKWLDSWQPKSVVYACLGSLSRLRALQLVELGLALEESNRPFIWVIREENKLSELEIWMLESGFEERIKGRGLVIRGWAPQVLILSHPATGAFLTHCGWNSTLEGVSAGVPMITWPLFAEQFYNEKFIVDVLKIGVMVGAESATKWGEEESCAVLMKTEKIRRAIDEVMNGGKEGEERRKRAEELGEKATNAVEGGSSHFNVTALIEDIMQPAMS